MPSWITYNANDMTLKGTPSATDLGTYTIVVTGTDTKNDSASTTFTIDVQKNYYPVVQKQMDDIQLDLGVLWTMQLDKDTFIDPNGDKPNYTAGTLPSWLLFNATTLKFTGTPTGYGEYNISVTARDAWNGSATMVFGLVAGIRPNHAPIANVKLED